MERVAIHISSNEKGLENFRSERDLNPATNLVPRVSHLNAWGERGSLASGVKMRDPGNEVALQPIYNSTTNGKIKNECFSFSLVLSTVRSQIIHFHCLRFVCTNFFLLYFAVQKIQLFCWGSLGLFRAWSYFWFSSR